MTTRTATVVLLAALTVLLMSAVAAKAAPVPLERCEAALHQSASASPWGTPPPDDPPVDRSRRRNGYPPPARPRPSGYIKTEAGVTGAWRPWIGSR